MIKNITKICSKCGEKKDISEFYKNKKTKDGLQYYCKKCYEKYYQNNKERIKKVSKTWSLKHPYRRWASSTLAQHRQRDYKTNITLNELEKLAKETIYCFLCGVALNWRSGTKIKIQSNSPTLDRKNNGKILNKNNIQIICSRCNMAKGEMLFKEFVNYCTIISNKFNKG